MAAPLVNAPVRICLRISLTCIGIHTNLLIVLNPPHFGTVSLKDPILKKVQLQSLVTQMILFVVSLVWKFSAWVFCRCVTPLGLNRNSATHGWASKNKHACMLVWSSLVALNLDCYSLPRWGLLCLMLGRYRLSQGLNFVMSRWIVKWSCGVLQKSYKKRNLERTHPDSSDQLRGSHIVQYHCAYYKSQYHWGYYEGSCSSLSCTT